MARLPSLLALLASATLLTPKALATNTRHAPVSPPSPRQLKRDLTTCEQTYGLGWARCGAGESTFCYNPSQGHVCCTDDSGYCERNQYCGPVAGYCCVQGEDFGTCADANGFPLPKTVDATWTTTWTRTTTVTVPRSSKTVHAAAAGAVTGAGALRRGTTIVVTVTTTATDCVASEATIEGVATMTGMFLIPGGGGGGSMSGQNSTTTGQVTGGLSGNSSMTPPRTTSRKGTPLASPTPSPSIVQASVAGREQRTLVWMALAIGLVGVFMVTC